MISMGLAYLVGLLPSVHIPPEDVAVISRQISLALVGVIILSSLRLVLRGVARVSAPRVVVSLCSAVSASIGPACDES